jgi:Phosphotransferase enzyme family
MRTAASAIDTSVFVLDRMRAQSRLRSERDDIVRAARAAYRASGGRPGAEGEWAWNGHRATWLVDDRVVKVTRSAYGEAALRRDLEVRTRIHADPTWAAGRQVVARTLSEHRGSRFVVVEERLPGAPLVERMHDDAVMARVRDTVAELHRATARDVPADDWTSTWFLDPAATVARLLRRRGHRRAAEAVTGWAHDVAGSVAGRTCRVVLVHGDLWPGNVLLGPRGELGLIDWDQASFHDVALHDALHLALYPVCHERRVDLGMLIRRLLAPRGHDPGLLMALRRSEARAVLGEAGVAERDALIWYWLRHVDRMSREPGHSTNPRWVHNNVVAVATTIHQGRRTT